MLFVTWFMLLDTWLTWLGGGTMSRLLVGLVLELLPPWALSALSMGGGGRWVLAGGSIMAGLMTGTLLEAGR